MTNFLYPFLNAEERDQDALLRDLAASAAAKAAESAALRQSQPGRRRAAPIAASSAIVRSAPTAPPCGTRVRSSNTPAPSPTVTAASAVGGRSRSW